MRTLALATLTAAAALIAAPALAQPVVPADDNATLEELIVTGHLPSGRQLRSISETVSYADLDLNYAADRDRLEMRVNTAARRVCTRLNEEAPNPATLGKSCQERAVRDAMGQVRQAFADAANAAYVDRYGTPTSATVPDAYYGPQVSSSRPIPDTAANRARYGGPASAAGRRTAASGN